MSRLPVLIATLVSLVSASALVAADAAAPAPAAAPAKTEVVAAKNDKPAPPAATPLNRVDLTAAVVAEGQYLYRQRDLDALTLIATRHAKTKLSRGEEEQLRGVLIQALTAREALAAAMAGLPSPLQGKARDALILDLIDYQGEKLPARPPGAAAPVVEAPTGAAAAAAAPAATPANAAPAAVALPPAPADTGPVFVRLPPLTMTRTLEGIGKRQMTLGLALYFRDPGQAKRLQEKAPLMQDAVLAYLQKLPPHEFAEANQVALKEGLAKAVIAQVPEFPADGILIPQLEVATPDAAPAK